MIENLKGKDHFYFYLLIGLYRKRITTTRWSLLWV